MESISVDEFKRVDLRVAKVLVAEKVEGSDKLLRLELDLGSDPSTYSADAQGGERGRTTSSGLGRRQIVAGIAGAYEPESLIGREIIVVANLEPRTFTLRRSSGQALRHGSGQAGLESQGMLLAASDADGKPVILVPEKAVLPGSGVK